MGYLIAKVLLTGVLIVQVSEVAKRSSLIGAILASLPLVSVVASYARAVALINEVK